jgi:hypothetical protein
MEWHTDGFRIFLTIDGIHDKDKFKTLHFAPQDRIKTKTARDRDKRPISLQVARVPPSPFHGKGGTLAT